MTNQPRYVRFFESIGIGEPTIRAGHGDGVQPVRGVRQRAGVLAKVVLIVEELLRKLRVELRGIGG